MLIFFQFNSSENSSLLPVCVFEATVCEDVSLNNSVNIYICVFDLILYS